jgi:hypothetical protein
LRINGEEWHVIGIRFEAVYASGRYGMERTRKDPAPELFHEWRKDTKYLWHQLQMLEPLWPGLLGESADYLGDDHDLWGAA